MNVYEVHQLLQDVGVSFKIRKFSFFRNAVHYLGHVLFHGQLAVEKDFTSAIVEADLPGDKTQLGSFVGSCYVFRRLIKDFNHV